MKKLALFALVLLAACRDPASGADHLALTLSATQVRAGDELVATVTALDAQNRRVRDFRGPLRLTVDAPADVLSQVAFDAAAAGQVQAHLRIRGAGARHVGAQAGGLGIEARLQVDPADPAQLELVSGDAQQALAGKPLAQPLVVRVRDAFANPVPGAKVEFSGPAGTGFEPAQAASSADGSASTHVTLGPDAGLVVFRAMSGTALVELHATAIPTNAAALVLVSGDGQVARPNQNLVEPLVVRAIDGAGNPVPNVVVAWSASGGASVAPARTVTSSDGTASARGKLGLGQVNVTFTARLASASVTFHAAPTGLSYANPPAGQGAIRLEYAGPGPQPDSMKLELVAAQDLSGFTVGCDLPLQGTRVSLLDFTPGAALPPGQNPAAAKAVISGSGPLAGMLVVAQSQKRAGDGAVPGDSPIAAGSVLFSFTLVANAGAAPGLILDGQAPDFALTAGLLDHGGTEIVGASGFAVGRLELH